MFFHKFPAPVNFRYSEKFNVEARRNDLILRAPEGIVRARMYEQGIVRIAQALGPDNASNESVVELLLPPDSGARAAVTSEGGTLTSGNVVLRVAAHDGRFLLENEDGEIIASLPRPFGVSGRRQMLLFERSDENAVVYGLGEKTGGLDKAGKPYAFWNVDVVAEHPHTFTGNSFDPGYASIPFLITKRGGTFHGIFLNSPRAAWAYTDLRHREGERFALSLGLRDKDEPLSALATNDGLLDVFLIPGPTLADVVRRFASLTGTHPVPPRWALGYHQCRWSYMSAHELAEVSRRLDAAGVPVGAMWMDIDYMEGFRVFTFNNETFNDEQRAKSFTEIRSRGTRLVTIIDPGVKVEPGYDVYDEGIEKRLFCENANGIPYVGTVWPGATVFPDFSLAEARSFWAKHIARHLDAGIDGIWNDMNDPSTGSISYDEMCFQHGTVEHDAYHNQYANLMAQATVDGFALHDSAKRPFVLTRSASPGIQRTAAVWTGDNASNTDHLAMAIPMSLNLALSGVSFNGPDVGGFFQDTTEELLTAWNLAGFLFPFYRNHSSTGSRDQEPDSFSAETLAVIRNCVNTRSKLLPYIYSLFHQHARTGDAVMRPVSWEFDAPEYERLDDQFMLGAFVLAAPFVDTVSEQRTVVLPPGWWFDMAAGQWVEGGRTVTITRTDKAILYARDGAILPCLPGTSFTPDPSFAEIELHVFHREAAGTFRLFEDDGETHAYQRGTYRESLLRVESGPTLTCEVLHDGYADAGRITREVFYGSAPDGASDGEAEWPFARYAVKIKAPR